MQIEIKIVTLMSFIKHLNLVANFCIKMKHLGVLFLIVCINAERFAQSFNRIAENLQRSTDAFNRLSPYVTKSWYN